MHTFIYVGGFGRMDQRGRGSTWRASGRRGKKDTRAHAGGCASGGSSGSTLGFFSRASMGRPPRLWMNLLCLSTSSGFPSGLFPGASVFAFFPPTLPRAPLMSRFFRAIGLRPRNSIRKNADIGLDIARRGLMGNGEGAGALRGWGLMKGPGIDFLRIKKLWN